MDGPGYINAIFDRLERVMHLAPESPEAMHPDDCPCRECEDGALAQAAEDRNNRISEIGGI